MVAEEEGESGPVLVILRFFRSFQNARVNSRVPTGKRIFEKFALVNEHEHVDFRGGEDDEEKYAAHHIDEFPLHGGRGFDELVGVDWAGRGGKGGG